MYPLVLLTLLSSFSFATTTETDTPTPPLGYWVTYNHGNPSSVIQMKRSASGAYYGVVVAGLFHGDSHPEAYCSECSDETWTGKYGIRQDEKVLGKSVLWNFKKEGDVWTHGRIIRIKSGNLFDASFTLTDDNQSLNMKVNAGFFKKTVTWSAISEDKLRQYCTHKEAYHENGKTLAIECIDALSKEPVMVPTVESDTSTDTATDTDKSHDANLNSEGSTPSTQTEPTGSTANTGMTDSESVRVDDQIDSANTDSTPQSDTPASPGADANDGNSAPADSEAADANAGSADSTPSEDSSSSIPESGGSDENTPAVKEPEAVEGEQNMPSATQTAIATSDIHEAKTLPAQAASTNSAPTLDQKTPNQPKSSKTGSCGSDDSTTPSTEQDAPSQPSNTPTGSCNSHGSGANDAQADNEPDGDQNQNAEANPDGNQGNATEPDTSETSTHTS